MLKMSTLSINEFCESVAKGQNRFAQRYIRQIIQDHLQCHVQLGYILKICIQLIQLTQPGSTQAILDGVQVQVGFRSGLFGSHESLSMKSGHWAVFTEPFLSHLHSMCQCVK